MTSAPNGPDGFRQTSRHHADLTALLRALKDRCRLPFADLAARTAHPQKTSAVCASSLKRAANGHTLPPEHVVTAYARACGATAEEERQALELWRAARAEQRGILATLHAPAVRSIRTHADLDAALVALYERTGAPPLRLLQERATTDEADGTLLLPLTTLWRITRREAQPATWEQCAAFLRGCGIHHRRMGPWQEAWHRIHTTPIGQPEPAPPVRRNGHGFRWHGEIRLPPLTLPAGGAWPAAPDHPSTYEPYALAVTDRDSFARLDPTDQHTLLAHLITARGLARRNGTAPDTAIDTLYVHNGKLVLLQAKHADTTTPAPA
ncbi:helix-turn-helix domain-containing protein [Streptomyces fagopyri]|uniref:helix-turn-helix domain-containing protein n=1 Tax=Streptomyces fagopyri TaxID=2662397 RepID=UPI003829F7C6